MQPHKASMPHNLNNNPTIPHILKYRTIIQQILLIPIIQIPSQKVLIIIL